MKALPKIPGYDLLTCLGGGQMTSVYAARERAYDAPCAVKVLRPDWQDQPIAVKLLQREARACLAISHPHLVKLRHAHVFRDPHFLVMEILPGESLRRRLRRDYAMDQPTALWVGRQIAEALVIMHRKGFIHGDIKPDNIRIAAEGQAVLLDLGFTHRPGENASLLEEGYILGTVNYLAPELCGQQPRDDFRSDIFSLGLTLYEMLTGQLPYAAGSTLETLRRHQAETPPSIHQSGVPMSPGLADLVDSMLAHEPEDRPRAALVLHELIGLEIAALGRKLRAA